MFKEITFKNYRTHKLTAIQLYPVTLLIGNNNSGKSNFLVGIQHFATLIRRARPIENKQENNDSDEEQLLQGSYDPMQVRSGDLFPHRYRLATASDSMSFFLANGSIQKVPYSMN